MDEYDQYTVQPAAAVERERLLMMMDQINTLNMPRWLLRGREIRRHHQHLPAQVAQPNHRGNILHLYDMLPPSPSSYYDAREQRMLNRSASNPSGLEQRRSIYRNNLWAQPLADVTGRTREFSLEFYRRNPATTHRLLPWITRDLSAICERSHIAVALERINTMLMRHDMRSAAFSQGIREYLGEHTRHFMHELISFARSPYDMMGYDRHVNHSAWYPRLDDNGLPDDDNDSDSEDDIIELPLSPSTNASLAISIPPIDLSNIRMGRDIFRPPTRSPSPEPGPSGLPAFSASSPFLIESSDDDDLIPFQPTTSTFDSGSLSDVEVVAVLKPKHERTPELIDLLSDSETIVNSPASPNTTQPASPQSSQPSSSRWDEPSTSRCYFDPGPSTSTYDHNVTDNASSGFKSESNTATVDVVVQNDSAIAALSDSSENSLKIPLPAHKPKHKKHKKYRYRFLSSDDEPLERHRSKHKKRKSNNDCEKKSRKRKRHGSPLRLSSSGHDSSVFYSKDKGDETERNTTSPKKSKCSWSWRVHELTDTSDDEIDQPPRIRSIVVKRQPPPSNTDGGNASSSSVSHSQPTLSDSDDSWQPYYSKLHKKSPKNKSKGSSKVKGKKK